MSCYPASPLANDAKERLASLDRDANAKLEKAQAEIAASQADWEKLRDLNNRAALQDFISRHPTSPLALIDARQRLDVLEREARAQAEKARADAIVADAWNKIKETTDMDAVRNFIKQYPTSVQAHDDAQKRLASLEQAKADADQARIDAAAANAWSRVKDTRDAETVRSFIRQFATSTLALHEAKERLDDLTRSNTASPAPNKPAVATRQSAPEKPNTKAKEPKPLAIKPARNEPPQHAAPTSPPVHVEASAGRASAPTFSGVGF